MRRVGQRSAENHLTIERGSRQVHHRILQIVAFGEQRIQGGNAALSDATGTGALNEVGQQAEYRRWIALRRGRFTNGQTNLALGMGDSGHAVYEQQDVFALGAKILRIQVCQISRTNTQQRRVRFSVLPNRAGACIAAGAIR